MHKLTVDLPNRQYDILIGSGLISDAGALLRERIRPSGVAVVSDAKVAESYGRLAAESCRGIDLTVFEAALPGGEQGKNAAEVVELCRAFSRAGLDRKAVVLAVGGGITGDSAGFAAAIYMRGIPFVQIPTTLLAMVDSSIGGKTGVNIPEGKNLLGVFHQPLMTVADISVLRTLPAGELRCGLAEAVKHGMILDEPYLTRIEANADKLRSGDAQALEDLVVGSCRIKSGVVARDELETRGERALLNFGHSFGHAFEKLSGYEMRHGDAVALGMLAACHLSEELFKTDPTIRRRLHAILSALELPVRLPNWPAQDIVTAMRGDKKNESGKRRLILVKTLGAAEVVELTDEQPIRMAVEALSLAE